MPVLEKTYPLLMEPKVQRDGTRFSERAWVDSYWIRFYRGRPKKMGGFLEITNALDSPPRGMMVVPKDTNFRVFVGTFDKLQYLDIDDSGAVIGGPTNIFDITPPVGFVSDPNNMWDFDIMYFAQNNVNILVANATPSLGDIVTDIETPIYYRDMDDMGPLSTSTLTTSGGIVALHPYLFYYGGSGEIRWTDQDSLTFLEDARPTSNKIVYGLPCRAGNSAPAGLFWSLDCLIRCTHTGSTATDFTFDSITCQSSVLSSRAIIEYDGIYYWAASDRFLMYNGVVQEMQNDTNLLYFFKNINPECKQKVWAAKNTQWGEIWFFYPSGISTECDMAVVYNVRTKEWLDTPIERSCGEFEPTFSYPIWAGNTVNSNSKYSLWMHEIGVNCVDIISGDLAVPWLIRSGSISWCASDPNAQNQEISRWVYLDRIEPDMIQTKDIEVVVDGQMYARSTADDDSTPAYTATITSTTAKVDIKQQRREMYLVFRSVTGDDVDSDFEMGNTLLVMSVGDSRQ